MLNITKEIEILKGLTVNMLRERYLDVFEEETTARNKDFLIKRIAWRIQANGEGGLSDRARRRAKMIANEADLRIRAPKDMLKNFAPAPARTAIHTISNNSRLPMPGTVLTRIYKDKQIVVTILPDGFEYEYKVYRSLSAVAKEITGTQWNGYTFFKLKGKGGKR
jgi:hypothetical protein